MIARPLTGIMAESRVIALLLAIALCLASAVTRAWVLPAVPVQAAALMIILAAAAVRRARETIAALSVRNWYVNRIYRPVPVRRAAFAAAAATT